MSLEGRLQRIEALVGASDDQVDAEERGRLLRVGIDASLRRHVAVENGRPTNFPVMRPVAGGDEFDMLVAYGRLVESSGIG